MELALRRLLVGLAFACLALYACPARACDTPVYRYALEHWAASPYHAVVFHRGPLSGSDKAVVDRLRHAADGEMAANIEVTTADTSRPLPEELEAIRKANPGTSLPWTVVLYPTEAGIRSAAWSGRLASPELGRLLHSPKRQEIVRELGQGSSAVCVLLESGNRAKDTAAEEKVRACLRKVEAELAPTPQVDAPETGGEESAGAAPLRFTTVRLSRRDPDERVFVGMLVGTEPSLARTADPILFALFGQGRMLCALPGKQISDTNIEDVAAFLVGDCSCEVKQQNPGVDLLMTANWYAVLAGQPGEGPTLPSLATLPAPAAKSAPAPAASARKPATPAARPVGRARRVKLLAKRPKLAVGIAGAAARLKKQRAAEARAQQAAAAKARAAGKVATTGPGSAAPSSPKTGGSPALGVGPTATGAVEPRPAGASGMKPVAPSGFAASGAQARQSPSAGKPAWAEHLRGRTSASPSEGRSAAGSEQRVSYPLAPTAPSGTDAPPSNSRLIAGAGVALLLGLALAAVAPRILAKRARGPRRPA